MSDFTILRCPACKQTVTGEKDLHCAECRINYPVKDGIPIFLNGMKSADHEQDLNEEKTFYEEMFSNLKGYTDGHCIVYGRERIYARFDNLERGTVIEVGCGGGHHTVALTKKGFDVTAIDLSENGLRAAKRLAEHEKQNVLFVCGDIKRLPFDDNQFDICFCSLILHHFISLDHIIRELTRVTRKYFVAYEVNALDPISFTRFNVINPMFGIRGISKNQRAIFPDRLRRTLLENGFRRVSIAYDDVHDYLGKAPDSTKAKMILLYQKIMNIFPEQYSRNKFHLLAEK
jgi:SAM-dependent methyltransferase